MDASTVAVALVGVDDTLLVSGSRTAGDCASFWAPDESPVV
jgi:hypothetical protein